MAGINDQVAAAVRCVVPLVVEIRQETGNKLVSVFTGFVIEVNDRWIWITASHVKEELFTIIGREHTCFFWVPSRARDLPSNFQNRVFWDPFNAVKIDLPKMLDGPDGPGHEMIYNDKGIPLVDICFYPLKDLYAKNLRAGGVTPLRVTRNMYDKLQRDFEEHEFQVVVIGVPASSVKRDELNDITEASICVLKVNVESADEDGRLQLVPGWRSDFHLEDLHGVSGGPILVASPNACVPLAVQSTQVRKTGIEKLRACRLDFWLDALLSTVETLDNANWWG